MNATRAVFALIALQVLLLGAAFAAVRLDAPLLLRGLLLPPALLWAPGLGWASFLGMRRGGALLSFQTCLDGAWIGVGLAVPGIALVRELSLDPPSLLGFAALAALSGSLLAARGLGPERRGIEAPARAVVTGALAVLCAVAIFGFTYRHLLARPLDAFWWDRETEAEARAPVPLYAPDFKPAGWSEAGAWIATSGTEAIGFTARDSGRLLLAARGPVGSRASVRRLEGETLAEGRVERDVEVEEGEGLVARYLDNGVVTLAFGVRPGAYEILADPGVRLHLLAGTDAIWALQEAGILWCVHPYQILNLVENQRWAADTWTGTRMTVNQPPLWAYVLAVPTAFVSPDLPGAASLFLWVLVLAGLSGVRLVHLLAPQAPLVAFVLPALATAIHGRLMAEPGSINFPDSLYAGALVAGFTAIVGGRRFTTGLLTPLASLLRYPGSGVMIVGALFLEGMRSGSRLLRAALSGGVAVLVLGLLGGAAAGRLGEWAGIVWFEFSPEHWHGDFHPGTLLSRAPEFYETWLRTAGGTPLLALLLVRGRALRLLFAAIVYSLLLCTIDHFPTHYFLPLVHLSVIAVAAGSEGVRGPWLRAVLLGLSLLGLAASLGGLLW